MPPALVNNHQQIVAEIKARAAADEQAAASQVHYQDLLDMVATPDPELKDPTSHLAWRSQHTIKHCGNGIQMAAVSTSPNQTPYQPLWAYMDKKSIQDHVWPWQQILLFIIRTQIDWPWRQGKPGYLFIITPMETACLEFCINPLVCAMAMLGRGEKAWQDPENYPPIISQKALWLDPQYMDIIHMWAAVAKQGAWTRDAADNDLGLIIKDEGFANGVKTILLSPPSSPPSLSHAIPIGRMVQKFMVHGQHGPVEVLLDWQTFGLKIHYNTTMPGHVTWMGQERLLYKEINFTMGKFHGIVHGMVPMAGHYWLVDRIAQEPAIARAFTTQGAVSRTKVQKYFQQVA
ncbi:hypothetical protein BDV19DRAFT_383564 [Aspergillus venezuelensis]